MSATSWVQRSLRTNDPERFAEACLIVEQLACSLSAVLKHPQNELFREDARRQLKAYQDGPE